MNHEAFQNIVRDAVGSNSYSVHVHLLSQVQCIYFERFLHTLSLGFSIPETLEHITKAHTLPDKNYYRYINYFRMLREFDAA